MKHKLESRLPGEISITSDMQITWPLGQKAKRNWRASWWKWEESEKVDLKLNIQKTKIMASGLITSWLIDRETTETVTEFIFLGSKITADGDYSHEIKTCYDQPRQHIKKQRHCFTNKGQGYDFSSSHVCMRELDCKESWAPKNRFFQTVVLEKSLEIPLDCQDYQSILKEISPEYSLEGLMM